MREGQTETITRGEKLDLVKKHNNTRKKKKRGIGCRPEEK